MIKNIIHSLLLLTCSSFIFCRQLTLEEFDSINSTSSPYLLKIINKKISELGVKGSSFCFKLNEKGILDFYFVDGVYVCSCFKGSWKHNDSTLYLHLKKVKDLPCHGYNENSTGYWKKGGVILSIKLKSVSDSVIVIDGKRSGTKLSVCSLNHDFIGQCED